MLQFRRQRVNTYRLNVYIFYRKTLGNFNILTASFMPAFLSSVFAILIERPSRRTLLSLYVSNVATETVWNMLEARQMVTPIKYGQVAIFGVSTALLLTFWRAGLYERDEHKMDPMFKIVRFVIGPHEQKDHNRSGSTNNFYRKEENKSDSFNNPRWNTNRKHKNIVFHLVNQALRAYKRIINKIKCCDRHAVCPHPFSCIYYILQGTTKMFSIGLGLQLILKLVLNFQTLFKSPEKFGKALFRRDTLQLANFLAGSSGIFRAVSCLLRRITGQDNPLFAFPAGLLAGIAFTQYPDTTIALYVFWKTAQIAYNLGIERRHVPDVPGFNMFLYCLSTGILFHVALLEPHNLRSSYWKFLINISGGRVACMNRKPLDVWGLGTSQGLAQTLLRTRTKEEVQFLGCKW
ncbi:hypothetical protein MML48_1g03976 [Holotrichia oblita]|uniref:Uncharacterized protein n=1 Tax=Holotrichia oblita TaxID=644536 RepID=A0ACB9TV18_HOLOL|nr:hypothetical protein MML48_1g03976 [Holotrichia oblita]